MCGAGNGSLQLVPNRVRRRSCRPERGGPQKVPRELCAKQLALGSGASSSIPGTGQGFRRTWFIRESHERRGPGDRKRVARKSGTSRAQAVLTRSDDRYLTLEERTAFANTHG
jgi:hypothetical protein